MKFVKPERAREKRAREIKHEKRVRRYGPLYLTDRQVDEFVRLVAEPSVLLETIREVPMGNPTVA